MVLVKRDNWGGKCIILERDLEVKDLEQYLLKIWKELEEDGWNVCWDSPTAHFCILAYRGPFESLAYLPYYKRVPLRRDWFIW